MPRPINRAPSCHLAFDDKTDGDVIMHDVHVPSHGVALFTYYCCLQWNTGHNGGGYCGIQEHPKGRKYIFSIWDPKTTDEAIDFVYKHPGTETGRFTGEGTGLRSINFDIGWKPDQWYTLVLRRWNCNDHTYFGFWVRSHDDDKWEHLISMDFPVSDVYFKTQTKSFIEDWRGSGEKYRRVHFKNGYKRKLDKTWVPFVKAKFKVQNPSGACPMYNDNYDGGRHDDGYFMQTGHGTTPSPEILDSPHITAPEAANSEPSNSPITFTIQEVTSENITWLVPESSTPQFAYWILVDGKEVASEINPQKRSCDAKLDEESKVEVVLEDIFGRKTSRKASMKDDTARMCSQQTLETTETYTPHPID